MISDKEHISILEKEVEQKNEIIKQLKELVADLENKLKQAETKKV